MVVLSAEGHNVATARKFEHFGQLAPVGYACACGFVELVEVAFARGIVHVAALTLGIHVVSRKQLVEFVYRNAEDLLAITDGIIIGGRLRINEFEMLVGINHLARILYGQGFTFGIALITVHPSKHGLNGKEVHSELAVYQKAVLQLVLLGVWIGEEVERVGRFEQVLCLVQVFQHRIYHRLGS